MGRFFSCDEHDRMMIVHSELECPLCKHLKEVESAKELADEALQCLQTDDLAMELNEVADMLIKSMEKLRK
jgi:phage gp46-like protein